ncbi:MAG: UPF0182 family protein [Actinobacteria bacterium]|uniref:Unannotated protein n=1 Tax=freshwater metagenome TaxID=449393 RepID=A0A6J6N926_9ZZZZ|nr:UPF0182 family protein [Actinomycetota bacterium]
MTQASQVNIRKRAPLVISLAIVALLAIALISASGVYTDVLWFDQLGYLSVFTTQIWAQALVFIGSALFAGLMVWVNIFIAWRLRPIYATGNDFFGRDLGEYRSVLDKLRKRLMLLVPLLIALFLGTSQMTEWPTVLTFLNHSYTGILDPQFKLDVGFYLFDLPFYVNLIGYLMVVTVLSLIPALVFHLVYGGIKFNGKQSSFSKAARIQVAVLASVFMALLGISIWLGQYETLTSASGLYTGATYSDVNAAIPAAQILTAIAFVVAIIYLAVAVIAKWRLAVLGTALMLVCAVLLGGAWPGIVQTFQVVPNERTLEADFIDRNIAATRAAYGLDNVETIQYEAKTTATAGALKADAQTAAQIRIIDPNLVSASFKQLEQYRQYYNFVNHLDVDRYKINGKVQDTVLAVRELNQSGLGSSQSWYNNVIVFTHGYGLVAAYGNRRSADGQPVFLQAGIPSSGQLGKYEPRIYFGENSPEYSIVGSPKGSADRELDYPAGSEASATDQQTMTTFKGNGGPTLDGIVKRLSYALKFQSEQILLSDAVSDKSQIFYHRSPKDRVAEVAPYLTLDSDIYPAIVKGKVVWIVDGYTTSANYPYSRAENLGSTIADSSTTSPIARGSINYIRNSVKATVDAYDGSVKLYAWDTKDPILKTWMKIFPKTVSPASEMSGALLSHVRYPADLFKMQRGILGQYHVSDAGAFYSQQDAWMTPNDPVDQGQGTGSLQPPYYLTLQAPTQKKPSFSIYSTFIPRSTGESSRNVLTAYLVADSDAGNVDGKISSHYGKLRLLTLPRTTIVPGPGQVQNNFNSDSEVSKLLNILRQGSTKVLNGNLLTLPVGGGLLYVQPVYIQSTGETSFPLLKKVLVAFGDKIAFEDNLDSALNALFDGNAGSGGGNPTPVDPGQTKAQQLATALAAAKQAMIDKDAAMRAGDWTAFGKADARLKAAIEAALAASKK